MKPRQQRFRIKLIALIVAKNAKSGDRSVMYTENISSTGALLKSSVPLDHNVVAIGDELTLLIQFPAIDDRSHEFSCDGVIVRGASQIGYGVKFNFHTVEQRNAIQAYLSRFVAEFPETIL